MSSKITKWGVDFSIGIAALLAYIFGIPWLKRQVTEFIRDPENPLIITLSMIPRDALEEVNRFIVSMVPQNSKTLVESILNEISASIHDDDESSVNDSTTQDDIEEVSAPSFNSKKR